MNVNVQVQNEVTVYFLNTLLKHWSALQKEVNYYTKPASYFVERPTTNFTITSNGKYKLYSQRFYKYYTCNCTIKKCCHYRIDRKLPENINEDNFNIEVEHRISKFGWLISRPIQIKI